MRLANVSLALLLLLFSAVALHPGPGPASITGKVTYTGTPLKPKLVDMSKQPECIKLHPGGLSTEEVVTGPGNTLQNVLVYISSGDSDPAPPPSMAATFDQQNCHYTTHVLPLRVGQDVSISNSDPFNHNIHPMARINREWNRIQLPGTPPFKYSYENEEFIPVKCNIHPWMKAYFVVLKTKHFSVTGDDGAFRLPDLPPGRYTVTAWQETYGTQSQDVTLGSGETKTINFDFRITR
ncbi:MAG TPA: carboxypeptidase regulatory-like domain-containing protein [Terriglobales bacterium]|nr:carboxypeptidase regulatory-like domain-containing protein [Terriglobales bacterium]